MTIRREYVRQETPWGVGGYWAVAVGPVRTADEARAWRAIRAGRRARWASATVARQPGGYWVSRGGYRVPDAVPVAAVEHSRAWWAAYEAQRAGSSA